MILLNKSIRIFAVIAFLMYLVSPCYAQESAAPIILQDEPAKTDNVATASKVTQRTAMPGHITMDFKDADINNVLRILAFKGGVNIVAGPEVTGTVTIRLSDVPWEKALNVILRTYGFAYEKEGNIIRVTTTESLRQEELTTEVYTLNFADSEEVTGSISEMLTDRGKIKFDKRTNVLVVTDIPTNLYKISQVVSKLDMRTPQVLIEAKIVETALDDSERLGIDWGTKISAIGAKKPVTFPFTRMVSDSPERAVERFFPVGSSTRPCAGSQFAGTTESEFPSVVHSTMGLTEVLSAFPYAEATDFTFGSLDFSQFKAVLEFLESRSDTDILSNPRITTLNNKEASILVGKKMLFPSFSFNEETGDFVISGFEDEKDLGVALVVTPHINTEGDIVVKLLPAIKDFVGIQTLDASKGIVAPIFTTREASAEVMIRDGETIMLGGLITKNVQDKKTRVPILGYIPLIGDYLFTMKTKEVERTELIIFITVHLVKERWPTKLDPSMGHFNMPIPKDQEVFSAIPREEEKKSKWWQLW